MQNLIDQKMVDEENTSSFEFCIDQHKYKLAEGQVNGFDKSAVVDTIDTLTEAIGFTVISERELEAMYELETN
jgi:hypothetical protein